MTEGPSTGPAKPEEAPTYLPAEAAPPADSAPALTPDDRPPAAGPPGASVFSLERRPGAGLYLLAWLFCGAAAALIVVAVLAGSYELLLLGVLAALVGLPAAAGYQILARSHRPITAYRGPSPILLFALMVLIVNVAGVLINVLSGNALDADRPEVFLVGLLIQTLTYVGVVWVFVVAPRALTWRDMLTGSGKVQPGYAVAVVTGVGVMLVVTFVAIIVGGLVARLVGVIPPQVVPAPETGFATAVGALGAIVLAPLGEELFFRGFALNAWWRDLGERKALIWSSLFFALVHVFNVLSVPGGVIDAMLAALVLLVVLLPVSFVLGALYVRRGLAASLAAHMTYNAIMFGLLLLTSLVPTPTG